MANTNIINAVFGSGICTVTTSAFRANYGMVLRFSGIALPTAFEVDFSNYDVSGKDSITAIGQNNEVQIPDDLWDSGLNIYAYVYLHPTDDSGVTVYTVVIPVLGRPNRTEEQPTPHEQSVIEQAISALNDAVEQTAADVVAADASASAAAQSEANAATSERSAADSAGAALASQNAAESAQQGATEQASASAESARNAALSATQAAESATSAQASAEQAERSVQSITDDVERAERAAQTATDKATEAASSAATASTKAAQAEQSATAAAQSASGAASAAQNAASSATAAESSASAANTAKTAAQAAQAAAESAAESVSGLSAQIEQNTADIADLVQSKAGALIDTASGSIASFVPDATIPTVKGLTVEVEPVQDLHGYDNPWPAGGGKNIAKFSSQILDNDRTQNGITFHTLSENQVRISGIATGNAYLTNAQSYEQLVSEKRFYKAGTYTLSGNLPHNTNCYIYMTGYEANGTQISGNIVTSVYEGHSVSFTRETDFYANIQMVVVSGTDFTTPVDVWVQLESGSTATSYAPYSNICPISGWDAVEMWNDPKYGGTIKWNQLLGKLHAIASYTKFGLTFTSVSDKMGFRVTGTYSYDSGDRNAYIYRQNNPIAIIKDHVYCIAYNSKYATVYCYGASFSGNWTGYAPHGGSIIKATNSANLNLSLNFGSNISNGTVFDEEILINLFDLTEMFGEEKANEIYNLDAQSPRGQGVTWFKTLFPNNYYEQDDSYTETCVSAVNGDPYLNYTIQLGQTVYGGTVDAVQGKMMVDRAMVDLGTLTWNKTSSVSSIGGNVFMVALQTIGMATRERYAPNTMLSSMFATAPDDRWFVSNMLDNEMFSNQTTLFVSASQYDTPTDFRAAVNGVQLVYELATPITVDLTPIEVAVITGQTNNIWADSGDVSVEYAADLKTYINNKIAAAVAALS